MQREVRQLASGKTGAGNAPSLSGTGGSFHWSALLLTLTAFPVFPFALQKSWCSKINYLHQIGVFSTLISIHKMPINW